MMADRSMLELKGISKAFGAIVVASDIDLTLSRGEALGVIGPNGAGKSTLFNLITGILRPDRGRIILEDEDITQMPPEARCRVGLGRSFQIPLPFTHLTVFENLSVAALFGAQVSEAEAVQLCGEILSLTGLETKANVLAGSLPLLDRKRLELARALATRPRILLLDEIAGGLTDAECHLLVETIREIRKGGVAIIWIEHVVHALLAVVDGLIALDFGKIATQGAPADVMRSKEVQAIYMGVPA
jgi:branched-chain amino acid transport system ATP-binding protein